MKMYSLASCTILQESQLPIWFTQIEYQMKSLAEMFDFQKETTLPLHCAEVAYRVKPI